MTREPGDIHKPWEEKELARLRAKMRMITRRVVISDLVATGPRTSNQANSGRYFQTEPEEEQQKHKRIVTSRADGNFFPSVDS